MYMNHYDYTVGTWRSPWAVMVSRLLSSPLGKYKLWRRRHSGTVCWLGGVPQSVSNDTLMHPMHFAGTLPNCACCLKGMFATLSVSALTLMFLSYITELRGGRYGMSQEQESAKLAPKKSHILLEKCKKCISSVYQKVLLGHK